MTRVADKAAAIVTGACIGYLLAHVALALVR